MKCQSLPKQVTFVQIKPVPITASSKASISKTSLGSGKPQQVANVSNVRPVVYRRRTPEDEIIETLAFVAEGSRISSLVRVKGHKEDTILAWIRDAAEHAEAIEEMLLAEYQLERGQLDGLWAYVRNKGEKKTTPKPTKVVSSGDLL